MRNFRATFTTAAFSTLFVLSIQHSDFFRPQASIASVSFIEQTDNNDSFAIRVANYDETVQWYRENLNATVEGEWQVPQNPDAMIAYLNVYGFRVKVLSDAKLPVSDTQAKNSLKYQIETTTLNKTISLPVSNLYAVIDRLEKRGVHASISTAKNFLTERKVAFIKDNNGNAIELVQSI